MFLSHFQIGFMIPKFFILHYFDAQQQLFGIFDRGDVVVSFLCFLGTWLFIGGWRKIPHHIHHEKDVAVYEKESSGAWHPAEESS